jgi:hypothetical protein
MTWAFCRFKARLISGNRSFFLLETIVYRPQELRYYVKTNRQPNATHLPRVSESVSCFHTIKAEKKMSRKHGGIHEFRDEKNNDLGVNAPELLKQ